MDNAQCTHGYFRSLQDKKKMHMNCMEIYECCLRARYPRVDKDLLMFAASFKRSPAAPELFCLVRTQSVFVKTRKGNHHYSATHLSEPARSTKFSRPKRRCVIESLSQWLSMTQVKTLCERLLSLFIFVAAIFLFATPYNNILRNALM